MTEKGRKMMRWQKEEEMETHETIGTTRVAPSNLLEEKPGTGVKKGADILKKAEKVRDAVGERRKKGRKVELELNPPPAESSLPSSRLASVLLNLQPLPAPQKRTSISISSTRMSGPPEPEGKLLSEALA